MNEFDLNELARAIAKTLTGSRLSGHPNYRDISAHAMGDFVKVVLDNGVKFEMRLCATTKARRSGFRRAAIVHTMTGPKL